jgi:hypothetical protein
MNSRDRGGRAGCAVTLCQSLKEELRRAKTPSGPADEDGVAILDQSGGLRGFENERLSPHAPITVAVWLAALFGMAG